MQRLQDYDRLQEHAGFSRQPEDTSSAEDFLLPWPGGPFKSLTPASSSELPPLRSEHVISYVQLCQGGNTVATPETGTLKKGKRLVADRIRALSVCPDAEKYFFSGSVDAAMRKRISYVVKMIIGKTGEIEKAACECPCGKGPRASCKHVCAAAFAVNDFREGKEVNILETCTETLQTFHRPSKKHCGSPVRADRLLTSHFRKEEEEEEDPRPAGIAQCSMIVM